VAALIDAHSRFSGARSCALWWASAGGQAMAETALLLPLLIFGVVGGADLARAYAVQLAVQNAARAGAEGYALSALPSTTDAQNFAVAEANRTPGLNITTGNVSVTPNLKADGTACTPPTTLIQPCYVNVRVTFTFRTVIPWPLVPNIANFDRNTIMRQIN
jgi:Flp pilus assembly protein TadG